MGTARFSLLRILADGGVHSRERIGRTLGLTPSEVARLAGELEGLGVRVVDAGDHCRLDRRVDLYDADVLTETMRRAFPALTLELLDECASTNTELVGRAKTGGAHGTVLACEHQSAGRGRRGAEWVSEVGGSVTFSVLWRFPRGAAALAGLSLAVAVSVADALERLGTPKLALKWPNDILCGGRKLGGILVETAGDAAGPVAAVVGVGVNVRLDAATHRRIEQPVTDLASLGCAAPRTEVLAGLSLSLASALQLFSREGFTPFRQVWLRRHAWQGRRVVLLDTGRRLAEGRVIGIAEDGALELASERGVERFHSGELSLRLG